jgi:uncharacterized protein
MRLGGLGGSRNVEDRRSRGPVAAAGGGLGLLILIGVIYLSGGDLGDILRVVMQRQGGAPAAAPLNQQEQAQQDEQIEFVSKILQLTEDVWTEQFAEAGRQYAAPKLVVFRGSTQTACGLGRDAMGPFYCPADSQVYIDLAFFNQLEQQLGAGGDFAQAYVIAHEVGHHVQNLLGYSDLVHSSRSRSSEEEVNQMSVRLELQADYLAGVWAHHAHRRENVMEEGDLEEGLRAANQIGDDVLQKRSSGRIVPENFTHGSAAQRVRWLKEGYRTGDASKRALDRFFATAYDAL